MSECDGATLLHSQSIESITFQRVSSERSTRCLSTRFKYNNAASTKKTTQHTFLHFHSKSMCIYVFFEHTLTRSHFAHINTILSDTLLLLFYKQSNTPTLGNNNNINVFCNFFTTFFASHTRLCVYIRTIIDIYACARTPHTRT